MKKPTVDDQKRLIEIDNQKYEVVSIPRTNKKVKVGWMKPHTFECVSKLMLDSGFEDNREYVPVNDKEIKRYSTFVSKYAALVILNGIKINLFYHIYWRWLYYVKGYDFNQLMPVILASKKKAPSAGFQIAFLSGKQMVITNMTMTEKEQKLFQNVLMSEFGVPLENSTLGL